MDRGNIASKIRSITSSDICASMSVAFPAPPSPQYAMLTGNISCAQRHSAYTTTLLNGGRGDDSARQMLLCTSSGHFLLTGNISSGNRLMALFSQLTSTTLHMTRLHVLRQQVQSSHTVWCGLSETSHVLLQQSKISMSHMPR